MSTLSEAEAFAMVVSAGSFSGAAQRLGISKSYASKLVTRLEDRLAVRLLHRTTRRLVLTEAGSVYYERCARGLALLEEAELEAAELQTSAVGTLRMTMPTGLGVGWLSGLLARFAAQQPKLRIETTYTDAHVDLLALGLDVAIRAGNLPDSSLVAVRLAGFQRQTFASPAYLAEFGEPTHPTELVRHTCLEYAHALGRTVWALDGPTGNEAVEVHPRFVANNGVALANAAMAGIGVAFLPTFHTARQVAAGELVRVLPEWENRGNVYAVYPTTQHVPSKVRIVVAFFKDELSTPPWERALR
jgi:DNA-binding transcriptional LysR family regulator